jgi:hypothetical protein
MRRRQYSPQSVTIRIADHYDAAKANRLKKEIQTIAATANKEAGQ